MEELRIKDERKRLPVYVDDVLVATAIYSPNDPIAYREMLNAQSLVYGFEVPKDIDWTEEEQAAIEKKIEDLSEEELELTNSAQKRRNSAIQGTVQMIDGLYASVDRIFGDGICEILLKYSTEDNNYLGAAMKIAFKDMNRARQAVKSKYSAKAKSGVVE